LLVVVVEAGPMFAKLLEAVLIDVLDPATYPKVNTTSVARAQQKIAPGFPEK
jgi:hypothetical protein